MKNLFKANLLASLLFTKVIFGADYFVSPQGDDTWSGILKQPNAKHTDGPFKTLERAKLAIRTLKKTKAFKDKVTVNIAAGRYILDQPLNFSLLDSGLPGREIVWQGEPRADVVISAGMPINCKKSKDVIWECLLPREPINNTTIDDWRIRGNAPKFELFVDGQKLHLARWPDTGWAHIKLPLNPKNYFLSMDDLPALNGDLKAAQVHIFPGNDWYDQYIGVDSIDQPARAIKLTSPTTYELGSGRRFYIQNLASLLNAPGEWIYDPAAKKVHFIPHEGAEPKASILTSLTNILVADGISDVTFKNIVFQHSAGTAITIKNSKNIILEQLDINNIGGKGLEINEGYHVRLNNSKIHHTGSYGIAVNGGERNTLKASGHIIYNNHIHHMGTTILTYSPGIEINGVGVTVRNNLLEQGAGTAILIKGNDHLIEKNEIHHFCLQASDCGAIYSGRDWSWRGNIIRHNYLHDIIGYGMKSVDIAKSKVVYQSPDGARGVYLDDGVSGYEINGNIFENAGFMAIQVGGGRDNKVVNNYIKTDQIAICLDDRDSSQNQKTLDNSPYKTALWKQKYPELANPIINKKWPEGNKIERNVIITNKSIGSVTQYFIPVGSTLINNNLFWNDSGKITIDYKILEKQDKGTVSWDQWLSLGIEKDSINTDPCITINNGKLTICSESTSKKIGFEAIPSDIGLVAQ